MHLNAAAPERAALDRAAGVLRAGGLVIYPTDTFYGLAADPRVAAGVAAVFAVKGRPAGQALPLVAASFDQVVHEVAVLSEAGDRLARRFWPGPLTLVADPRPALPEGVAASDGSIAVRVPDHAVARGLADALGFAIVATSANPSGGSPSRDAADAARGFEGRVELVLDAGHTPGDLPSTIVDARFHPVRLLRAGAVPFEIILESIALP
jgi:L-threonylcarbamoyladenylate synthase